MAIVGIDEVGRGAWAGPLVVGAVVLDGTPIEGLTDSKKLTKVQRELYALEIRQKARAVGLGWVSAKDIDRIGLSRALRVASKRALRHIHHAYHEIIIDGTVAFIDDPRVTVMKKADLLIPSVSAASIVAKVARDSYMKHLDALFSGYGFGTHVGYGTARHRAAIASQGVTPLHRLSFAPLAPYATKRVLNDAASHISPITTKRIGDRAETEVTYYLEAHGHSIIERNWKTKYCEIDIISSRDNTIYFTEVKYRKSDRQGTGFEAITLKKQKQMTFAAEYYVTKHKLHTMDVRLAAADVKGETAQQVTFLELVL